MALYVVVQLTCPNRAQQHADGVQCPLPLIQLKPSFVSGDGISELQAKGGLGDAFALLGLLLHASRCHHPQTDDLAARQACVLDAYKELAPEANNQHQGQLASGWSAAMLHPQLRRRVYRFLFRTCAIAQRLSDGAPQQRLLCRDRKTTGSAYLPAQLAQLLIASVLLPVIADRLSKATASGITATHRPVLQGPGSVAELVQAVGRHGRGGL